MGVHDGNNSFAVNFQLADPRILNLTLKAAAKPTILAATHDVLLASRTADSSEVDLMLVYADFYTLVGRADTASLQGGVVLPIPAPPPQVQCIATVSSQTQFDAVVLCTRPIPGEQSLELACSYSYEPGDALNRALVALSYNAEALVNSRLSIYQSQPTLSNATYDRLAKKVYSVMRVNTLAAEGPLLQHWSTPDRVPHRAMWLWDRWVLK